MERPASWSDDDDLADEIELYGELVVAASAQEAPLTADEIDSALGVDGLGGDDPEPVGEPAGGRAAP